MGLPRASWLPTAGAGHGEEGTLPDSSPRRLTLGHRLQAGHGHTASAGAELSVAWESPPPGAPCSQGPSL